ncbi:MAG: LemA family protein [Candidatus Obscuribacterales bacterium]|jgi:LemA protein|nr:LemA family protein [Cyanobacteria bacterium SZAS LIN-5]RTL40676.1 MAG: LemA family protein [Candidatus Melainabacteria bacterium]
MWLWIVLGIIVLLAFWMIGNYNHMVMLRQNVRESWSAIETELRRRYDLIPNLVETVKGYATHEKSTLEEVIRARNSAVSTVGMPDAQNAANMALTGALTKLVALSEAYPELKANDNFNQLQRELTETETRISQARRFYNANVRELNAAVESFPTVLVATSFGFRAQPYFGIEDPAAFDAPAINFGGNKQAENSHTITLKQTEEEKST